MNLQRNFFIVALLFVSFIIWQVWERDKHSQSKQQVTTQATTTLSNNISSQDNKSSIDTYQKKCIKVRTDVLELTINTYGGNVEQALLLAYPKKLKSKEPFQLLRSTSEFVYQAQSGLFKHNDIDNLVNDLYPLYSIDKEVFILNDDQNEIIASMRWIDATGNIFTKTFTMRRGEYVIDVSYNIQNIGIKPLVISTFGQLKQSIKLPSYVDNDNNNITLHTFRGAAYSTSSEKYKKYKFNTIAANKNLNIYSKGGWIAMLQQYFVTAWIPYNNGINNFYTINLNNDVVIIGYRSEPILVQPGQSNQLRSKLWIGPEIQDKMANVAPYLDLTVDYGWLWFISQPLFKLLKFMYSFLGNWGYSIIAITFLVRCVMYPFTKAQLTSMARIRMLQPKIQAMRTRLSDNKQRQNQEIIDLYKSEKINPLGGCFPLLIQMPIFLALYYMLMGSVELRHAPFILWIQDLSSQDPYYILPILMGITMFFIQRMSSINLTDQKQQKIITIIPIIFTIFFLWFPSGLVLYYIVSNLVTIIQQQLIYRSLENCGLYKRKKKDP